MVGLWQMKNRYSVQKDSLGDDCFREVSLHNSKRAAQKAELQLFNKLMKEFGHAHTLIWDNQEHTCISERKDG